MSHVEKHRNEMKNAVDLLRFKEKRIKELETVVQETGSIPDMDRAEKNETVFNASGYDVNDDGNPPDNLNQFIQFFTDIRDKIPEAYRESASIIIEASNGWDDALYNIKVSYKRPETDKEYISRALDNELSVAREEMYLRKEELEQLEYLKNKYEGTN